MVAAVESRKPEAQHVAGPLLGAGAPQHSASLQSTVVQKSRSTSLIAVVRYAMPVGHCFAPLPLLLYPAPEHVLGQQSDCEHTPALCAPLDEHICDSPINWIPAGQVD